MSEVGDWPEGVERTPVDPEALLDHLVDTFETRILHCPECERIGPVVLRTERCLDCELNARWSG